MTADTLTAGGAEIIGNNLFLYAANNPINYSDATGQWIFKDAVKWVAKNIVKPIVKKVQKSLAKVDLVATNGISVNAATVGSGSASIQVVTDTKGNIALQTTQGVGGGTTTAGISSTHGFMFAPSYKDLEKAGGQYGGSASISGAAIGVEYVNAFDQENGKTYHGFNVSSGIGAPIPLEFHGEVSNTQTITHINVFEEMSKIYHKIMEW